MFEHGTMVFYGDTVPHWVIEWQANNGPGCYWLVNANGDTPTASPDEVTLYPILQNRDDSEE